MGFATLVLLAPVWRVRGDQVSGLVIVAQNGVTVDHGTSAKYDFGTVDPIDTPHPSMKFTLRNDGAADIVINRVQTSCGCTSAVIASDNPRGMKTLAPKESVNVTVTVDMALYVGNVSKLVWTYLDGQAVAAATLEVVGNVTNPVTTTPNLLYFGDNAYGNAQQRQLTLSVDPRLLAAGAPLPLKADNPDITIDALPVHDDTADGKAPLVRSYLVNLSPHASVGPILGWVSFSDAGPIPPGPSGSTLDPAFRGRLLAARAGVGVSGNVTGKVSASPQSVYFGDVKLGQSALRSIKLTALAPVDFAHVKVTSSNAYVTAAIAKSADVSTPDSKVSASRTLAVSVKLPKDVPTNAVEGSITVSFADGERLVVPVSAYVDRTSAR